MQTTDLLLLIVPLIVVLLVLVLLVAWMVRLSTQTNQVPLLLLDQMMMENQSLRNQLRAPDLMTLHSLNSGTRVQPTQDSTFNLGEGPMDEYQLHLEAISKQGLVQGQLTDDLIAAGWSEEVYAPQSPEFTGGVGDQGGSPVIFRDEPTDRQY